MRSGEDGGAGDGLPPAVAQAESEVLRLALKERALAEKLLANLSVDDFRGVHRRVAAALFAAVEATAEVGGPVPVRQVLERLEDQRARHLLSQLTLKDRASQEAAAAQGAAQEDAQPASDGVAGREEQESQDIHRIFNDCAHIIQRQRMQDRIETLYREIVKREQSGQELPSSLLQEYDMLNRKLKGVSDDPPDDGRPEGDL